MRALQVFAGPRARQVLQADRLHPAQVRMVSAAAGGPKGLALIPLDQVLFGDWLPRAVQPVHLIGASIGAWRMAAACRRDPVAALALLARDYIQQDYPHAPGRAPKPEVVSQVFAERLAAHFGGMEPEVLAHPRYHLHVFTSRGRHLLRRPNRWRMPVGFAGAFVSNLVSRRALGGWLERVVFSDPRAPLPMTLQDLHSQQVSLTRHNLLPAVLASCSIPFWLSPVEGMPDAPEGAYWDGGLTDYHLHLRYADAPEGLVLYPHFQSRLVPGWLDKMLAHRHHATPALDNVVVLAPDPAWVARLPGGKLPDRGDFMAFGDDLAGRQRVWQNALAESQRLADDFMAWVDGALDLPVHALP